MIVAVLTVEQAETAAMWLDKIASGALPTRRTVEERDQLRLASDALFALCNDTDAVVTDDNYPWSEINLGG